MTDAPRFAPVLRYLVEKQGMYCHPSRTGYVAGQEVWAKPELQFSNYNSAREYANWVGGTVLKLRVSAKLEKIKGSKTKPLSIVIQKET